MAIGKPSWIYISILIVGLLCLSLLSLRHRKTPIRIADVYVINMDKSQDRWEELRIQAKSADMTIHRWRAVDGTQITEETVRQHHVSKLITRHTTEKKQPGVVGCFLSHKMLLRHLEATDATDAGSLEGHLILEDDAAIPADFWDQWNALAAELPHDWDIVQIGVTYPNLKRVPGCERVHSHSSAKGNVGAFAYVVRHGALPKINEHLSYMYDPIDVMIRNKQNEWRIYFAWPQICPHNDHGVSTIVPHVKN